MAELNASNDGTRAQLRLKLEEDEMKALAVALFAWRKTIGKPMPREDEWEALFASCEHDSTRIAAWQMVYHGELTVDVTEDGQVEFFTLESPPRKVRIGPDPQ